MTTNSIISEVAMAAVSMAVISIIMKITMSINGTAFSPVSKQVVNTFNDRIKSFGGK